MYSTKTIHKNINPNYKGSYTSIGDPYSGNNELLPSRWKEKQFVTQKFPKNAENGLFVKLRYNSEPYTESGEKASLFCSSLQNVRYHSRLNSSDHVRSHTSYIY